MVNDVLKSFYENDASRFWDPRYGMRGRDLTIHPLLNGLSGTLLEYGSGSGSLLLSLALDDRFSNLVGVDISESALRNISAAWHDMNLRESKSIDKLKLFTPVNDSLPMIPDNTFDILLSLDTIEHVINPYVVLDELYRVAKPGATFIISVPNYGYIKYVLQLLIGRQPVTGSDEPVHRWRVSGWDGWHLHTFTKEGLNVLLRDCGWEPILWTGYGDRGKWLGLNYLRTKFPAFWSGALTVVCQRK